MKFKVCNGPGCEGKEQPYSAFDPDLGQPDNLDPFCRECVKIRKGKPQMDADGHRSKTCRKCGRDRGLEDFGKDKRTPDGYAQTCKACRKAGTGKRAAKSTERVARPTKKERPGKVRRDKAARAKKTARAVVDLCEKGDAKGIAPGFRELVMEALREVVRERFDELVEKL